MVQGTMSNAGKSLVTAGLCRVFNQDGYKVAPFKSQNMALNSFITRNGAEMGRAQVVQAEAANIEPSALMNPILLKPTSDSGSQVIVNGEAIGTMTAAEYFKFKTNLIPDIMKAYGQLSESSDVIVIEGAGSPAEINLKSQDIVNMGMAKMAKAPVLLVADIDRGGVFASIYGTLMLLEEDERAMVKGIIVNKFRGDVDILRPGLKMIEEKTGVPVVGVLPMLHVDIEDEDSLSERLTTHTEVQAVDIAVIRIPRMSNYTDFNVFELIPGVSLRYVQSVSELKNPDMIVIPGTKNTIGDLKWMRQNGLEAEIMKRAHAGTVVFGICGGYQMLGKNLSDPYGVEEGGDTAGLGLLDVETIFAEKKRTIQVDGYFGKVKGIFSALTGLSFYGYEIHSGITNFDDGKSLTLMKPIHEAGEISPEGSQNVSDTMNVYGTYVHGVFDGEGIALAGRQMLLSAHRHIADGPLDGLVQLGAAVDTGDGHLVLQGQIAVVDDTQLRQGIGAARLPQNLLARSGLDEVQRLALGGNPAAAGILHLQSNIQLAGLDLVDTGGCGVGEPCEGSAYQHGQAQNHGHDAAQQGPFGTLAVCHSIFPLFFCVCVGGRRLCGGCGKYGFSRRGCAPPQNDTPFGTPPYHFLETIKSP